MVCSCFACRFCFFVCFIRALPRPERRRLAAPAFALAFTVRRCFFSNLKSQICNPPEPARPTRRQSPKPVIPKAEQPDFRAHSPRTARKLGAVARPEESRRRHGGNLRFVGTLSRLRSGRLSGGRFCLMVCSCCAFLVCFVGSLPWPERRRLAAPGFAPAFAARRPHFSEI